MSYVTQNLSLSVGVVGSMYGYFTGDDSVMFQALGIVMMLDILLGLMRAIKNNNLRSYIMTWGILKKASIILSVVFAFSLDIIVNSGVPVFTTMMTWLAIGNESLSIIENLNDLGIPIPSLILDKIKDIADVESVKYKEGFLNNSNDEFFLTNRLDVSSNDSEKQEDKNKQEE